MLPSDAQKINVEAVIEMIETRDGEFVATGNVTAYSVFQAVTAYEMHRRPARGELSAQTDTRLWRVLTNDEFMPRVFSSLMPSSGSDQPGPSMPTTGLSPRRAFPSVGRTRKPCHPAQFRPACGSRHCPIPPQDSPMPALPTPMAEQLAEIVAALAIVFPDKAAVEAIEILFAEHVVAQGRRLSSRS